MIRCWDSLRHPKWIKHNLWRANNLASFWKNAFYTRWTTLGEHSWAGKSWRSMRHCSILPRKKNESKTRWSSPDQRQFGVAARGCENNLLNIFHGLESVPEGQDQRWRWRWHASDWSSPFSARTDITPQRNSVFSTVHKSCGLNNLIS